jgi:hypothetical protein
VICSEIRGERDTNIAHRRVGGETVRQALTVDLLAFAAIAVAVGTMVILLVTDYVRAVRAADGARAKIEVYAAALGRLLPETVPLADALRVVGTTDEACRSVWQGLTERRGANMRLFARDLRGTGELRADSPTTRSPTWCGR